MHICEVYRYVDLNPVRAGMFRRPQDWAWSSYRAHTGKVESPVWLDSLMLHRQLVPRAPRREGPERYAQFVAQGRDVRLWEEALSGQIFLGGEKFIQRMQAHASLSDDVDVPRVQRRPVAQPLQWYLEHYDRDTAIVEAFVTGAIPNRRSRGRLVYWYHALAE
jgi:hypothetical protein